MLDKIKADGVVYLTLASLVIIVIIAILCPQVLPF